MSFFRTCLYLHREFCVFRLFFNSLLNCFKFAFYHCLRCACNALVKVGENFFKCVLRRFVDFVVCAHKPFDSGNRIVLYIKQAHLTCAVKVGGQCTVERRFLAFVKAVNNVIHYQIVKLSHIRQTAFTLDFITAYLPS